MVLLIWLGNVGWCVNRRPSQIQSKGTFMNIQNLPNHRPGLFPQNLGPAHLPCGRPYALRSYSTRLHPSPRRVCGQQRRWFRNLPVGLSLGTTPTFFWSKTPGAQAEPAKQKVAVEFYRSWGWWIGLCSSPLPKIEYLMTTETACILIWPSKHFVWPTPFNTTMKDFFISWH